jgi:hypothetical protein
MFRHHRVILRELATNTLPSYTSISNAAVGSTIFAFVGHCTVQYGSYKLQHNDFRELA